MDFVDLVTRFNMRHSSQNFNLDTAEDELSTVFVMGEEKEPFSGILDLFLSERAVFRGIGSLSGRGTPRWVFTIRALLRRDFRRSLMKT